MNNYRIHYFGPMLFQTELSNEQATSIENLLNKKQENNFQAQLAGHLKDEIMPKYAQLVYDGFWWSPEREALQALIDKTQEQVTGSVDLSLYKGNVTILGRSSEFSLYDSKIVTFEDDENAYNQADATGFIKINSLRLKQFARRKRKINR